MLEVVESQVGVWVVVLWVEWWGAQRQQEEAVRMDLGQVLLGHLVAVWEPQLQGEGL